MSSSARHGLFEKLEGHRAYAIVPEGGVWLAVDGEALFIAKGETRNSKEAVVVAWPAMFSETPPKTRVVTPTMVR